MIDSIAQELGVPGGVLWALLAAVVVAILCTVIAYAAAGVTGILRLWVKWPIKYSALGLWRVVLKPSWVHGSRLAIDGYKSSRSGKTKIKVDDPTTAELVDREVTDPRQPRGMEDLDNDSHSTVGGLVRAVHKLVCAQADSGKNQTDLNYELQDQLEYSPEHLIVLDPKTPAPLTKIVYAYARPEDRIFIYSFHPKDRASSSLRLFRDPDEASDLAYMLTDEPGQQDSHWNGKAGDLIVAVATALSQLKAEAERAVADFSAGGRAGERQDLEEITVTLNEIRDVIVDRERLNELIAISPLVSNVADESKEWGYIRSTASRRLSALSSKMVRRVFAGGSDTPQPDFARRDGRDIVVIRPHARSAERLTRYIYAVLDANYRQAADAGDAGGPGVKVLVDEAASYMKLERLPEYIDLGRESKVRLTYVLQGMKQLKAKLKDTAESVITNTDLKVLGASSDTDTAEFLARLSGKVRVHYRKPRQDDEILGQWGDEERPLIQEHELLRQAKGQWTIQQGPRVWKVEVPERFYHYTQARPPVPRTPEGIVDPDTYKVPPILFPSDPENADGGAPEKEPVAEPAGAWIEDEELLDDPNDLRRDDDWLD